MFLSLTSIALLLAATSITRAQSSAPAASSLFTAPAAFPTSIYAKYYNNPTATASQPQPIISDPVTGKVYPFNLTNPKTLPGNDTVDPHPFPPKASGEQLRTSAVQQVLNLALHPGQGFDGNSCAICMAGMQVAKFLAMAAPEEIPEAIITLCNTFHLDPHCSNRFSSFGLGGILAQVFANADMSGTDGQLICQNFLGFCPFPTPAPLNLSTWFSKSKPDPLPPPKKPSGERLKVLHLSDFHLDPRYAIGAEANCTGQLCCRTDAPFANLTSPTPQFSAPRFGAYLCDTPFALAGATLEAIPALTGTEKDGFAWGIYTGDLVSHDPENELSRDYTLYAETVVYDLMKRIVGGGSVYATLGNHDTYNSAQDAPHNLNPPLSDQFSWNYDHVAGLWAHEGWLPAASVAQAKAHYGGYSVQRSDGLRVISINTDFWYNQNLFNYINSTSPDNSGMLAFLISELEDAEAAGDRVWIIGHVLSGWAGTDPLHNPTNLFYQIVDRFSPHVIANVFFGHSHEDQLSIFYANNGTVMNASTALNVAWMGPSVTPLTNFNSGFRVYEVDSSTFEILDAFTYTSDVFSFPSLESHGPVFGLEYSTRETYGGNITGWGANDPLNATWWQLVTEQMELDSSLVETLNLFETKSSPFTKPCAGECITAKICYMRSGSPSIALANCQPGFG